VTLTEAFAGSPPSGPAAEFAHRFAGLPVRNSGTLGGNVANGSPIGDSMPLLIALGAQVVLASQRGRARAAAGSPVHRLPPERDGARRVLVRIKVPSHAGEQLRPTRSPSASTTTSPPSAWC
jgi:xanthine dehydrogenase small subunit